MAIMHERNPEAPTRRKVKETVESEADARLQQAPYRELHTVACSFDQGVLTLKGRVSTYYMKQLAQTVVRELDGVRSIHNRVQVTDWLPVPVARG